MNAQVPVNERERAIVLELLGRGKNEAGIALALGAPYAASRVLVVLKDLERNGLVVRESEHVWREARNTK